MQRRLVERHRMVGNGGGPYAKTLAEEMVKPGIEAVTMFRNVQLAEIKYESIGQDPWLSFPSLPAVRFAGSKPPRELGADVLGSQSKTAQVQPLL